MKKLLCFCISLMLVSVSVCTACAESETLTTIDSALQSDLSGIIEVRDDLSAYHPLNEAFPEIEHELRLIILQREAPMKEFTAKTEYPPFTDSEGFDDDFTGIDLGEGRTWVRSDLMAQLPSDYRAASLEDANYLIIAEDLYEWNGTIYSYNYKETQEGELPEFENTDEMIAYFIQHPKTVESSTCYPKFGVYSIVTLYETATKKRMTIDYKYTEPMRFARNPEAVLHWDNMAALAGLLDALENEEGPDVNEIKKSIETIDFVEQPKKDLWASCIDASEYSTAYYSISGAFWSMAEELRALDPSSENRENYDLIIKDMNRPALSLFVSYCDYSGFDRSISSIESERDYIAKPDYDWMEQILTDTVALFN